MADEQHSNNSVNPVCPAAHPTDLGAPTSSVTSPSSAAQGQQAARDGDGPRDAESTDPSSSSAPTREDTAGPESSTQPQPSQLLWNTPEGRIAAYRRMMRENQLPGHHDNLEALIRYYEDGGKVPEGEEEVWAVEGQATFGTIDFNRRDQLPADWFRKRSYCDSSKHYQLNVVPRPGSYMISDRQGRVYL